MDRSGEIIKAKCTCKRMIAIAVMFSVAAILSIIPIFQLPSVADLVNSELLFGVSVNSILENISPGASHLVNEAASAIDAIIVLYNVILWLPELLVAVCWWLIFLGQKQEKPCLFSLGLKFYIIRSIYNLGKEALILLALFILPLALGFDFRISLLAVIFYLAVKILGILYDFYVLKTAIGFSITNKTNENHVHISKYVLFFLILNTISAGVSLISALIVFSFTSILSAGMAGATNIILFQLLREYRAEAGDPGKVKIKEQVSSLKAWKENKPATPVAAPCSGTKPYPAQSPAPAASVKAAPSFQLSRLFNGKGEKKRLADAIACAGQGMTFEDSGAAMEAKALMLFDEDYDILPDRYSKLGESDITNQKDYPVVINALCVLKDAISERKILRIRAINRSGAEIGKITLRVEPFGHLDNRIGVMEDVPMEVEAAENGANCFSGFGIILPDAASSCHVTLVRVDFSDGLYWNKATESCAVQTVEKQEFDKRLFNEYYNG